MAIRIGIVGFGGMGSCHLNAYGKIKGAEVVALCDVDKKKLSGQKLAAGNIEGMGGAVDLASVATYTDMEAMLDEVGPDVVDICLPTYLHAPYAVKALRAGVHVISEKPMAIDGKAAKSMIAAAEKADRRLFVAQCIRFWPAYAKLREILAKGTYGKVVAATFTRVGFRPTWTWKNWMMDETKSGGAALDLHIHDADFILHAFGTPKRVTATAGGTKSMPHDHIVATYDYPGRGVVMAEGGWAYAKAFGFSMAFRVAFEKGTLVWPAEGELTYHPIQGKSRTLKVPAGDGYEHELKHFVDCLRKGKASDVVSPESARQSVRLIELEKKSAREGKPVPVRF